jgi:hypothetical protein
MQQLREIEIYLQWINAKSTSGIISNTELENISPEEEEKNIFSTLSMVSGHVFQIPPVTHSRKETLLIDLRKHEVPRYTIWSFIRYSRIEDQELRKETHSILFSPKLQKVYHVIDGKYSKFRATKVEQDDDGFRVNKYQSYKKSFRLYDENGSAALTGYDRIIQN